MERGIIKTYRAYREGRRVHVNIINGSLSTDMQSEKKANELVSYIRQNGMELKPNAFNEILDLIEPKGE